MNVKNFFCTLSICSVSLNLYASNQGTKNSDMPIQTNRANSTPSGSNPNQNSSTETNPYLISKPPITLSTDLPWMKNTNSKGSNSTTSNTNNPLNFVQIQTNRTNLNQANSANDASKEPNKISKPTITVNVPCANPQNNIPKNNDPKPTITVNVPWANPQNNIPKNNDPKPTITVDAPWLNPKLKRTDSDQLETITENQLNTDSEFKTSQSDTSTQGPKIQIGANLLPMKNQNTKPTGNTDDTFDISICKEYDRAYRLEEEWMPIEEEWYGIKLNPEYINATNIDFSQTLKIFTRDNKNLSFMRLNMFMGYEGFVKEADGNLYVIYLKTNLQTRLNNLDKDFIDQLKKGWTETRNNKNWSRNFFRENGLNENDLDTLVDLTKHMDNL